MKAGLRQGKGTRSIGGKIARILDTVGGTVQDRSKRGAGFPKTSSDRRPTRDAIKVKDPALISVTTTEVTKAKLPRDTKIQRHSALKDTIAHLSHPSCTHRTYLTGLSHTHHNHRTHRFHHT